MSITLGELFRLEAAHQQTMYARLISVARAVDDDPEGALATTLPPSELSLSDIISFRTQGQSIGVNLLSSSSRTTVFVQREEVLQKLYQQLKSRDLDKDGSIDEEWLARKLEFSLSSEEELVRRVFEENQMATLKVEPMNVNPGTPEYGRAAGSGFITARRDNGNGTFTYEMTTNAHVAAFLYEDDLQGGMDEKVGYRLVTADNRHYFLEAELIGSDPLADVALLQFTTTVSDLPVVRWAHDSKLAELDTLVFIGNSATVGIVPAEGEVNKINFGSYPKYPFRAVQHDASTWGGNSGGPGLNLMGEVEGILFRGYDNTNAKVGLMIPAERALKSIANIRAHQKSKGVVYGHWGFFSVPLPHSERALRLPEGLRGSGVEVIKVFPNSPAEKAGLRPGDILLAVNGDRFVANAHNNDDMHRLETLIKDSPAGRVYTLEVFRSADQKRPIQRLKLKTGQVSYRPLDVESTAFGFIVYDMSPYSRATFNVPDHQGGVWVQSTTRGGQFIMGHIITHVNNRPVKDVAEFRQIIGELTAIPGQDLFFTVLEGAKNYTSYFSGQGVSKTIVYER